MTHLETYLMGDDAARKTLIAPLEPMLEPAIVWVLEAAYVWQQHPGETLACLGLYDASARFHRAIQLLSNEVVGPASEGAITQRGLIRLVWMDCADAWRGEPEFEQLLDLIWDAYEFIEPGEPSQLAQRREALQRSARAFARPLHDHPRPAPPSAGRGNFLGKIFVRSSAREG
jgi:hypothetical protein